MDAIASILDTVQPTLSPYIWDHPEASEPVLKPKVAAYIKRTIYNVLERHGYSSPHEWLHLCLTGSLTTYQYADDSDCDISLFVDSKVFPEWSRAEMIGIMISEVDGGNAVIPGTPYPLQCFVVARKFQPADLYRPGLRSGYDVDGARWIVPPEKGRSHDVQAQEYGAYAYGLQMADKMERLLRYEPEKAEQFWHQIHARRMRDQSAGKGDYSDSNVVYKFLAKRGLMPEIAQLTGEHIAAFDPPQHNLTWQQGGPGKGFVLQDGSIWTWPTAHMRPVHHAMETAAGMQGAAPVKRGSEFHIEPHGRVWQYNQPDIPGDSPGYRSMDPDDRFNILKSNAGLWFGQPGDEHPPNVQDDGYGHATAIMPKMAWTPSVDGVGEIPDLGDGVGGSRVVEMDNLTTHLEDGRALPLDVAQQLREAAVDVANTAYQGIVDNGGITVGLNGHQPSSGYAFSPYPQAETIIPNEHLTSQHVHDFIQQHAQTLAQPGHYLGGWVDGPHTYLDISRVHPDRDEAFQGAQRANQLAMFDLSNFEEIPVLPRAAIARFQT